MNSEYLMRLIHDGYTVTLSRLNNGYVAEICKQVKADEFDEEELYAIDYLQLEDKLKSAYKRRTED